MSVFLTRVGDTLEVKLEGSWSLISDAKDKVKEIPGRRWNNDKKVWILPADPELADQILKTLRPEADQELMSWLKQSMVDTEESLTSPLPDDADDLLFEWAYRRAPWQPELVNDEAYNGALPYQRAGISHIAKQTRALLADDMGLGKTYMLIAAVEEFCLRNKLADNVTMPVGPKLVVAPASVLGGWNRELHRWLKDPNVQIVDAKTPQKRHDQLRSAIQADAWTIVNWEQIRVKKINVETRKGAKRKLTVMKEPLFEYPQAHKWDLSLADWDPQAYGKAAREFGKEDPYWLAAFADEIHRAKNKDSQQTKGLHRIQGQLMSGATGTPIMNSPDELWALLRWLWPDEYHERGDAHAPGAIAYWPFYNQHVKYYEDHFGRKTVTGVKNPEALRFSLKGKVIRRTAGILGLKGRKRFFYDVPLNPGQQKLYNEAETSMWLAVEADVAAGNKDAIEFAKKAAAGGSVFELMRIPNGAARFVRLQQIIENAALLGGSDDSAIMDDFVQKYEDSGGQQWIYFCNYKQSCELLAERLRKAGGRVAVYNGDVSSQERTEIEDKFQRGELDAVVGTIAAMYQGITLTSGHLQGWLSRDVVPAKNEQGEARQDRLGQQNLVQVYIPQASNTVAINKVHVINRLKESIVKVVINQDSIEEVSNA